MFRDENEKVLTKARAPRQPSDAAKRTGSKSRKGSADESGSSSSRSSSVVARRPEMISAQIRSISPALSAPLQDEGIRFFFTHYVSSSPKLQNGEVDCTKSSPQWSLLSIDPSFNNAVSSVGFAGLSNVTKDPEHTIAARKKYAASLRDITLALQDTSKSDLDATFKSVMLLAAFEIVNGTSQSNGGSWAVHIDGAAAILKLMISRRPQGLPATRLQMMFVLSVCFKALSRGEQVPSSMHDWTRSVRRSMDPVDAHSTALADIMIRCVNFLSTIKNVSLVDSISIYLEAVDCDAELRDWNAQLPEGWRHKTIPTADTSEFIYEGHIHVYEDLWRARMYTNYRWMRIMLSQVLLEHQANLAMFATDETVQREDSLHTISELAHDICTSISSQLTRFEDVENVRRQVPPMSGVFLLLLPISIAGSAMGVPESMHQWCIRMLEYIGNKMGIYQALEMVGLVKMQRGKWIPGNDAFHVPLGGSVWKSDALITSLISI
ncbi:hypothetical protein IFR04_011209 [Cadophora malorum]|uniref:Uncharacterized protein n=1 Tax=Cadophora malorum TaxID=108018 RepID=A0A8H7T6E8_9HELO|nr:hypothetical protein IFR04_011209 [Cadophora malorum]